MNDETLYPSNLDCNDERVLNLLEELGYIIEIDGDYWITALGHEAGLGVKP